MPTDGGMHVVQIPIIAWNSIHAIRANDICGVEQWSASLLRETCEDCFVARREPERADVFVPGFDKVFEGVPGFAVRIKDPGYSEQEQRIPRINLFGLMIEFEGGGGIGGFHR